MNQTATRSRESVKASIPHTGAADAAETPRPTGEQQHDESGSQGSRLLAPLRWLGRKLSGLVRWVVKRLRAPLRPIARLLMLRWVAEHLPAPLRWLGRLFAPGREHGFGFWWLMATLAVAVALGLVVALLLAPVAGLIALLVVAIWLLVRRRRRKRDDRDIRTSRAPARGTKERFGTPGRTGAEAPATAAAAITTRVSADPRQSSRDRQTPRSMTSAMS
jgi:hypothetical protein